MTVQKIVRTEIVTRFESINDGPPRQLKTDTRVETYVRKGPDAWILHRDEVDADQSHYSRSSHAGITPPMLPELEGEDEQRKAALAKLTPGERSLLGL